MQCPNYDAYSRPRRIHIICLLLRMIPIMVINLPKELGKSTNVGTIVLFIELQIICLMPEAHCKWSKPSVTPVITRFVSIRFRTLKLFIPFCDDIQAQQINMQCIQDRKQYATYRSHSKTIFGLVAVPCAVLTCPTYIDYRYCIPFANRINLPSSDGKASIYTYCLTRAP